MRRNNISHLLQIALHWKYSVRSRLDYWVWPSQVPVCSLYSRCGGDLCRSLGTSFISTLPVDGGYGSRAYCSGVPQSPQSDYKKPIPRQQGIGKQVLHIPSTLEEARNWDVPSSLTEAWRCFLSVLFHQGFFKGSQEMQLSIQQYDDVREAVLHFSRARADILFTIPVPSLIALADIVLVSERSQVHKKLKSAHKRLRDTYILGIAIDGPEHASFQDVMRVVWDVCDAPEEQVKRSCPGGVELVRGLLQHILGQSFCVPEPWLAERAAQLATPSLELLEVQAAAPVKHGGRLRAASLEAPCAVGDGCCQHYNQVR